MNHTITEFKEWPKGLAVSYHDWIVLGSKTEIMEKLGFKPRYTPSAEYKTTYQWKCNLDNGRYYFTIYDMSYGRRIGKDEIVEYHIGFNCSYDDIHDWYPKSKEALDMIQSLNERGLTVKHSSLWEEWHENGVFKKIEDMIKKNIDE